MTRVGTDVNGSIRRIQLNERFDLKHLRHDLGGDRAAAGGTSQSEESAGQVVDPGFYEDGPAVFDPSPDVSFLPHLVSLCKQHNIQLHFHRIKRRPVCRWHPPRHCRSEDLHECAEPVSAKRRLPVLGRVRGPLASRWTCMRMETTSRLRSSDSAEISAVTFGRESAPSSKATARHQPTPPN